jgi:hypothetical protein
MMHALVVAPLCVDQGSNTTKLPWLLTKVYVLTFTCLYAAAVLQEKFAQIFSYASQHATDVDGGPDFMDDAIRIERCGDTPQQRWQQQQQEQGLLDSLQQQQQQQGLPA